MMISAKEQQIRMPNNTVGAETPIYLH